ncbi:MAG: radical SAM protein [Anaerolineae bacterium]|nr:radical SAM protein [Anaerolineae bacterium]
MTHATEKREEATCWRVSSGTAAVLGLSRLRMDVAPTTAYLMLGERCQRNCAFCTQARTSQAGPEALSRVAWPPYPTVETIQAIARAYQAGEIQRTCFQVTVSPGYLDLSADAVAAVAQASSVPICVSVVPRGLGDVERLLEAGSERVTMALDAATPGLYGRTKSGSWDAAWRLLEQGALAFPGRVGTHLIVGLGETECEMIALIQRLLDLRISVALFAFTPVPGTALADRSPPNRLHYRRVQAARWLMVHGLARAADMHYDRHGRLSDVGPARAHLAGWLADGEAFRTSGCPGCNRPYYNERPGGVLYNYPRPLTQEEAAGELADLLADLPI